MTHINNYAFRSLRQFSLNKDNNHINHAETVSVPGQKIKRFLTHQPIVPPISTQQDTFNSSQGGSITTPGFQVQQPDQTNRQ